MCLSRPHLNIESPIANVSAPADVLKNSLRKDRRLINVLVSIVRGFTGPEQLSIFDVWAIVVMHSLAVGPHQKQIETLARSKLSLSHSSGIEGIRSAVDVWSLTLSMHTDAFHQFEFLTVLSFTVSDATRSQILRLCSADCRLGWLSSFPSPPVLHVCMLLVYFSSPRNLGSDDQSCCLQQCFSFHVNRFLFSLSGTSSIGFRSRVGLAYNVPTDILLYC